MHTYYIKPIVFFSGFTGNITRAMHDRVVQPTKMLGRADIFHSKLVEIAVK